MSNLGLVNRLFFQFLFVRLTKNQETKMINYQPVSYDLTPNGVAARGYGDIETTEWYSIQYWILPFSGWGNNFHYIGKKSPRYWRITKNNNQSYNK